jgi:hypothetical protein
MAHFTFKANPFMSRFLVLVEIAGVGKCQATLVTFHPEFFMHSFHVLGERFLCIGLILAPISAAFVLLFFMRVVGKRYVLGEMVLARCSVITILTWTLQRIF